jgi:hypothetical protein
MINSPDLAPSIIELTNPEANAKNATRYSTVARVRYFEVPVSIQLLV